MIEAIIEMQFAVEAEYIGSLESGYYLHTYPQIDPAVITVVGLRGEVESISRVIAMIALQDASASFAQDAVLQLFNADGERIDSSSLDISSSTAAIFQEVMLMTEVDIVTEIYLPETMRLQYHQIVPDRLHVYALVEALEELQDRTLLILDFVEADESTLFSWGLRVEDLLWQILYGEADVMPEPQTVFVQSVRCTLDLPAGVRWADSISGTPIEIDLILEIEWLGSPFDNLPPDDQDVSDEDTQTVTNSTYGDR